MQSDVSICSSSGCALLPPSESGDDDITHVVLDESDDDKSISIVSNESIVRYRCEF